jgi:small subunit ribosomal protein S17
MKNKNIGIETTNKPKEVFDHKDAHSGTLKVHGRTFTGKVVSDKMQKTVSVEWTRKIYLKKYERYAFKKTKVKAHNPPSMDAKMGDMVVIMETRPLSKTKNFTVIEVLK